MLPTQKSTIMKKLEINATISCTNWNRHGVCTYKDFTRSATLLKFLNEHNYPYKVESIADIHIGKWSQGKRDYELHFNNY